LLEGWSAMARVVGHALEHVRLMGHDEIIVLTIRTPQHVRQRRIVTDLVAVCGDDVRCHLLVQAWGSCKEGSATVDDDLGEL